MHEITYILLHNKVFPKIVCLFLLEKSMNSLISWFTRNSIAANLLMLAIVLWGISSLDKIIVEAHPAFQMDAITVQVAYRGATPAEVEESLVIRIEEVTQDLEGIKSISSEAREGSATITFDVLEDYSPRILLKAKRSDSIKSVGCFIYTISTTYDIY